MTNTSAQTARKSRGQRRRFLLLARRYPLPAIGALLLTCLVCVAIGAPWLAPHDPLAMVVTDRLRPPSAKYWFGTDQFGRDILSRAIYGGRVSLLIAVSVAVVSTFLGFVIGAVAGLFSKADAVLMRVMDGLMAIPGILLAVAFMSLTRASVSVVIVAIAIPEVPRVARLVRSVVLTVREQTYMRAAESIGVRLPRLILRYILPNTMAPLIVLATYVCASAVLLESYLSFLGAGTPPETPSWGNIIAEGRLYLQIAPWNIIFPGVLLALMVLSINLLGDGLRDMLDPRLARQL